MFILFNAIIQIKLLSNIRFQWAPEIFHVKSKVNTKP